MTFIKDNVYVSVFIFGVLFWPVITRLWAGLGLVLEETILNSFRKAVRREYLSERFEISRTVNKDGGYVCDTGNMLQWASCVNDKLRDQDARITALVMNNEED